ncbi:HDOD domain-containing protein [bacterium]|nr:HDOD domain-containing protein [bacterium]MBU1883232.1 HDOD domain-containing protein [bacterium]
MTYESLVKNIDKMPPLSDVVNNMQALYVSGIENVNTKKLVKIIEADIMLSANILKIVNSPYYGFSQRISSIAHAVMVCGAEKTYSLILHYAIGLQLGADTAIYGLNNTQFNEMCVLQSSLMMQWYAKINLRETHLLSLLALIMESGKLIIAEELVKSDYLEVYRKGFLGCGNIHEFEREFLDTTSYALSAMLFEHWNLEPLYTEILKALDSDNKEFDAKLQEYVHAIHVVRTAINLKEVLTEDSIEKACSIIENDMKLSSGHFRTVSKRIREAYAS